MVAPGALHALAGYAQPGAAAAYVFGNAHREGMGRVYHPVGPLIRQQAQHRLLVQHAHPAVDLLGQQRAGVLAGNAHEQLALLPHEALRQRPPLGRAAKQNRLHKRTSAQNSTPSRALSPSS